MSATELLTARQWAQVVGLGLGLVVVVVAAVALVLPALALALALALVVVGVAFVSQRVSGVARQVRSAASGVRDEPPARPTLTLELADGTLISARPVELPGANEHTLALTREGYVVLGDGGRLIHRL